MLLAREGNSEEAAAILETTVQAKPDYALGWFNLAVINIQDGGPTHFLEVLGARGRASRFEPRAHPRDV